MTKKEVLAALQEKEKMYSSLVWYARSNPENQNPTVVASRERVEAMYPVEVDYVSDPERDNWDHGFNSGVLATLRYVQDAFKHGVNTAEAEFPYLDT